MDEMDIEIAKIVADNARISFRRIANQLGISTKTVIKRYKRLRKKDLPYSSISVNLCKLGYIGQAAFLVTVKHKRELKEVCERIANIPNIIVVIRTLGTVDIWLAAPFKNIKQLLKIKQDLANIPGVSGIELLLGKPFASWPLNVFSPLLKNQIENP